MLAQALAAQPLDGKRVLVIIPDATRTAPIPLFFRLFHQSLWGRVASLDYLVALGTHQPTGENALNRLVGISAGERIVVAGNEALRDGQEVRGRPRAAATEPPGV